MIPVMSSDGFFSRLERACGSTRVRIIDLNEGEALFHQGDDPLGLLLVTIGTVDLLRWTKSGHAVKIHTARPNETFAEASIFTNACQCGAVAAEPSVVRLIPKRHVLGAFNQDSSLALSFAANLADSLMRARRLLELRAITPLKVRAHIRLGELANADGFIPEGISLVSIAAELQVTPAALYRAISALEAQGIVERPKRGNVRVTRTYRSQVDIGRNVRTLL